jgi:hypothetical protein
MELNLVKNVFAAVEVDGQVVINADNSVVYESVGDEEAYIYIKSATSDDNQFFREVKIRFLKKDVEVIQQ